MPTNQGSMEGCFRKGQQAATRRISSPIPTLHGVECLPQDSRNTRESAAIELLDQI